MTGRAGKGQTIELVMPPEVLALVKRNCATGHGIAVSVREAEATPLLSVPKNCSIFFLGVFQEFFILSQECSKNVSGMSG